MFRLMTNLGQKQTSHPTHILDDLVLAAKGENCNQGCLQFSDGRAVG